MHHACVVACALLIVTSMTLAARPSQDLLRQDVIASVDGEDILAAFSADCIAREKTSIFGLKRGVLIQCTVTAVTAA